ncbi:MAG: type I-G CRISPR-associated helicase/endonuclease Cas3g, partial [Acidimicrobiales bacterium]
MTDSLQIADFPQFFHAVNGGADPFPWQVRLAKQVDQDGRWPSLLNLPTGSGKTAAIDIAVFLRALRDDQPRRIVFVVDRRVIVHQAFQRAKAIAESLAKSHDPIVEAVARQLRSAAYDRGLPTPLVTAELRGGIAHDETWAMRPDIPAVLVSTVDQVGSRLLFRGYGVSRGMRPVHAGLLGNDVVFMLDEVHLARPFKETLRSVGQYYRHLGPLPDRWQIVELSATPDRVTTDAIQLEPKDRDNPVLGRRLSARKPVTLWPAKERGVDGEHQRAAVADACVDRVDSMADLPQVRRIGVVVNRVATAVAIYQRLARRFPDAVLLTGRMRPFDREDIDASLRDQWLLGRDRRAAGDSNVLVSTQAIEAGADLDLDGLVTECAPFDALVQRFGRVDRNGFLSQAGTPAPGFIVATGGQRSAKVDDAIYGPALARTWQWLESLPDLDFGPDRRPVASEIESLDMQIHPPDPPILLPVHLRAWAQTSPPPHADPDPDLWLHGLRDRADLDVSIVWRADLGDLSAWDRDALVDWVLACPPTTGEAMAVPIGAAKAWLTYDHDGGSGILDDVSDVDGLVPDSPPEGRRSRLPGDGRAVLLWRADDQSDLGHARDLRPGDTMVVPASYGGVTGGSWDPRSSTAVVDLGLRAQVARKSRIVLRLVEELLPGAGCPLAAVDSEGEVDVEDLDQAAVAEWLRSPSLLAWCQGHTDEPEPATLDRTALKVLDALQDEDSLVKWSTRRLGRPGDHTALVLVAPSPATVANA